MSPKNKATEALNAGKEAVETAVATSAAAATKGIEQAQVAMKEQLATAMTTATGAFKAVEDVVDFQKGTIEAFVKSGQIWAAGVQDMGKALFAQAQANMEEGMATAKALAQVKSLKEAMDLQGAFAKTAVEKAVAEAVKTQETTVKLVETAFAPVADRAKLAMETFAKPLPGFSNAA
jgi:phasin family protein